MEKQENKITCIIIDDETDACDRLESLLNKIPSVQVFSKETNPEAGIKKIETNLPDLVFLDVEMPGMTGFDVVETLKKKNLLPTFIFVTGYDQYAIKAIRNAAFDFLVKPVDIDELKDAIARFCKNRNEKQKLVLPEKLKKQYSLTDREIEIIELLIEGKTSQQIADKIFISKHTVDTHRRNILEKTKTNSTNELSRLLN